MFRIFCSEHAPHLFIITITKSLKCKRGSELFFLPRGHSKDFDFILTFVNRSDIDDISPKDSLVYQHLESTCVSSNFLWNEFDGDLYFLQILKQKFILIVFSDYFKITILFILSFIIDKKHIDRYRLLERVHEIDSFDNLLPHLGIYLMNFFFGLETTKTLKLVFPFDIAT